MEAADNFALKGEHETSRQVMVPYYGPSELVAAWSPYLVLVGVVLLWGVKPAAAILNKVTFTINWPGLHNEIQRMPPAVLRPAPYAAVFTVNWLAAAARRVSSRPSSVRFCWG